MAPRPAPRSVFVFPFATDALPPRGDLLALERTVGDERSRLDATSQEMRELGEVFGRHQATLLRQIDRVAERIEAGGRNGLDASSRAAITSIRQSVQRIETAVHDIEESLRVSGPSTPLRAHDLSRSARAVAAELHTRTPHRDVRFVIQPGLRAHGDPNRLGVVVESLLRHAWHRTAGRAAATIEFSSYWHRGRQVFFVHDDGDAPPPPAGSDSSSAPTVSFDGRSIDLAVARRVVEGQGGRVWAGGVPGRGATVCFSL